MKDNAVSKGQASAIKDWQWPLLGHFTSCSYYHKTTVYVDWGEFWECSRVHKRSPWFVENERGIRHSSQVQESETLRRFCQVTSAHNLRRKEDSESVKKRQGGQWLRCAGGGWVKGGVTARATHCMDSELDNSTRSFVPSYPSDARPERRNHYGCRV